MYNLSLSFALALALALLSLSLILRLTHLASLLTYYHLSLYYRPFQNGAQDIHNSYVVLLFLSRVSIALVDRDPA